MAQPDTTVSTRCAWVIPGNELYERYHDQEWGVPVYDDGILFEFLILEGAQAGLSWLTILRRREGYRRAFANFDHLAVAQYNADRVEALLQDPGIIRNRLKVTAAVTNAQRFLEVQREFGSFSAYQWAFMDGRPRQNHWHKGSDIPAVTPQAEAFSADLRRRGFRFVGPTIMYAHMQAVGMVNDHTVDCFRYKALLG